jgi:hypothetical protein
VSPDLSDQDLLKMASPTIRPQQTIQQVPTRNDYSVLKKKKVKINAVEKKVHEYDLTKEEVDYKK